MLTPEDKRKESSKRYYEKHKEKILQKSKESKKARAARQKYRNKPEVKERIRNAKLLEKYGITSQEYEDMLTAQNYRCAGCGIHQLEVDIRFAVDHNHNTGKVRGLLCGSCNRALGLVKDDQKTLSNLINYLEKYDG